MDSVPRSSFWTLFNIFIFFCVLSFLDIAKIVCRFRAYIPVSGNLLTFISAVLYLECRVKSCLDRGMITFDLICHFLTSRYFLYFSKRVSAPSFARNVKDAA